MAEKTDQWNYALADELNTQRQLTDVNGEVIFAARYTPWGDTLETYGDGSFAFGYFGGVMDEATGLLYVGNGQYYDPQTGRFLTRDAKPNQSNPYIPWDPTGALIGPLGLMAVLFSRRKKGGKWSAWLALFLVIASVSMGLAACGDNQQQGDQYIPVVVTDESGNPQGYIAHMQGGTVVGLTPVPTGTPMPTPTYTCTITPSNTPTPTGTPTPPAGAIITVEHRNLSSYYTVYENEYPSGSTAIKVTEKNGRRALIGEYLRLDAFRGYTNDSGFAQKASGAFLYDPSGLCTQGSEKLNNGLYISCVDDINNITGFDWFAPDQLDNVIPFPLEVAAKCPFDYLTPFQKGDIVEIPALKEKMKIYGKDEFFKVTDTGGGLCETTDSSGSIMHRDTLDIYAGEGPNAKEIYRYIWAIDDTNIIIHRGAGGTP